MRTSEITRRMLALGLSRQQAFELISHFCGMEKSEVLLDRETEEGECLEAAKQAAEGKPIQYIIGEWDFLGKKILCREGVLIPREDTEAVVYEALRHIKKGSRVLDLCCGSGCISVAAADRGAEVTAVDINPDAVRLTQDNAALWGVSLNVIRADIMHDEIGGEYDVIISNPPYIKSSEIKKLDKSVRAYEPRNALDGGGDGLDFYRCILKKQLPLLTYGGRLVFEIGFDLGEKVTELVREAGLTDIAVFRDDGGNDRCVSAQKKF